MKRKLLPLLVIAAIVLGLAWWMRSDGSPFDSARSLQPGEPIDSLHGVVAYHNGGMNSVHGRLVVDGYNVGLRYQCVEYVKRNFLERHGHRMPNSYGHAKDFFQHGLTDGAMNADRGLLQFSNPSKERPQVGDLLVLDAWAGNSFGHVAIVSDVSGGEVEVIQQNCATAREAHDLDLIDGRWRVGSKRVLGWLRMP